MKRIITFLLFAIAVNGITGSEAFGQIAQRGSATSANSTNTTLTITKPTGVVSGDLLIVNIAQRSSTAAISGSGWTVIDQKTFDGGTTSGAVLYKVAGGSEPANYSFSLGAGANNNTGTIVAFSGVDVGSGPFDVAPGTLSVSGANGNTATATGLTTVSANAGVLMVAMINDNQGLSNWSTTSPGTLTELYENQYNPTGANDLTTGGAFALKASAGATGNGTVTIGANSRWAAMLLALKPAPVFTVNAGPDQLVGTASVALSGSTNAGSPAYVWTQTGGPAGPTITSPNSANTTVTGLVSGNLYTFRLTVNGSNFDEVSVRAQTGTNLWATSSSGTQISSFTVSLGTVSNGPTNMFSASFTGASNTYTRTAALGRTNIPSITAGYFYYLGTSDGGNNNAGLVEIWGASATGTTAKVGQIDMNAGSNSNLGFVRLGMGPDGTGWILAGDGTTLFLASFASNGLNSVTPTIVDASVTLVGGAVATFVNGDLCLDASGKLVVLANNGSGTTEIYTGLPAGASTTLTKKWDVFDGNGSPFTGSVNGVAFDLVGGLYLSTADGLYYINQATANSAASTVNCTLSLAVTGLQDLASNVFPNTIITPVSMSSFSVTRQGSNAMLNWTTVTEINTSYFEIERSLDGINFSSVGSKMAAGNSTDVINYQFADPIGAQSGVLYYRIKTVDQDGKVSYSKIVSLRLNGMVKAFNVYPNPFSSDLKIELDAAQDAMVTIRINNAAGQTVFSRNNKLQKGNNVIVLASELTSLQKGMYVIEVISENNKQIQKIIKR